MKKKKSSILEIIEILIFYVSPIVISLLIGLLFMYSRCGEELHYNSYSFTKKFMMVVPWGLIIGMIIYYPINFIFKMLELVYEYFKKYLIIIRNKLKLKEYKNKFKGVEIKNRNNIKLIKEIKNEDLEIKYLYMNNEDKYNYYKRKDVENLLESTSSKIGIINELTNKTIQYNIKEILKDIDINYRDMFSFNETKVLKELLDFCNLFTMSYDKIYNEYKIDMIGTSIGKQGEDSVNKNLQMYSHRLINIRNTRFEIDGQPVETDNLILSKNGIFSLEVKNLGATGKYDIRVDKDGKWNKIEKNKVLEMSNVTSQTYRHIALTEKLFIKELNKLGINREIVVHPLIVLANDKVNLENNSDIKIIRTSNIYKEICNENDNLSEDLLNILKEIILKNNLPAKSYETIDILKSAERINSLSDILIELLNKYNDLLEEILSKN